MRLQVQGLFIALCGLCWGPGLLAATDDPIDEATFFVVEEGTVPEDIVNVVELPTIAPGAGSAHSQGKGTAPVGGGGEAAGQGGADTALLPPPAGLRVDATIGLEGRALGEQIAEEARNNNIGEQIRDELRQNERARARGRPDDKGPP